MVKSQPSATRIMSMDARPRDLTSKIRLQQRNFALASRLVKLSSWIPNPTTHDSSLGPCLHHTTNTDPLVAYVEYRDQVLRNQTFQFWDLLRWSANYPPVYSFTRCRSTIDECLRIRSLVSPLIRYHAEPFASFLQQKLP